MAAAAIRAERLYQEAEWLNAWVSTFGEENLQVELDRGRQLIWLSQSQVLHPGSDLKSVYEDSLAQQHDAEYSGRDVLAQALSHLVERIQIGDAAADGPGE